VEVLELTLLVGVVLPILVVVVVELKFLVVMLLVVLVVLVLSLFDTSFNRGFIWHQI
jgi:VIT1/CCC1 family predicted Fe2+/Mn2+ transporter